MAARNSTTKLRTHYWLLAFAIVLPVAVFSTIALNMLLDSQRAAAIGRIEESARSTTLVIDADIHRAQSVLRALAHSHALATGDLQRFYEEASAANAGQGAWIILYDTEGQQLVNTRHPYGRPLPKRPDPESMKELLRKNQGAVSGIKWGWDLKNNFVMVEQPITTAAGARHVIGQAFSPSYFTRAFAGRAIPDSWLVGVVDGGGTVIARRHNAEQFVGKQANPDIFAATRAAGSGSLRHVASDGTEVYDYFVRSTLSDWSVVVGAPAAEVDAAIWRGVSVVLVGLLIAIGAVLAMAVSTGRRLVGFISRASQAALALGGGQPVTSLKRSNIVETEALNVALREAGDRLQNEMRSRADAEQERNELLVSERAAREHAERQNQAKDEFLAMLGHELRNPLSAITSAVALLEHGGDGRFGERARDVLRRQSAHLSSLVDDLLEVNRALMGKLALNRGEIDLANVVAACLQTLQTAGRLGPDQVELHASPAPLLGDSTRLAQVVDNILDNAIKYSPLGAPIVVTVARRDADVELVVRDAGAGIPAELLPQVFNVFVQGAQSLQRIQGGLGIGLTLVRRLVELHGGSIVIDSPGPGLGTTVTVRLPAAEGMQGTGAAAPAGEAELTPTGRRVLLVEDNVDAREMMVMLLELHGCVVLPAGDGPAAIALAEQGEPDLALIDIGLPGMDGYALAQALKSRTGTSAIRLIALTGYGAEADRQRALAAGFALHIVKPLSPDSLRAALALDAERQGTEAAATAGTAG